MDRKVCLDTNVVIDLLKDSPRVEELDKKYPDSNPCITTITIFELLLRKTNLEEINRFIADTNVLAFDEFSSRIAASTHKYLKSQGVIIPINDLFIASICLANNCSLATFNKKHFENIKELKLI